MKKIASMNKNEILTTLQKVAIVQTSLLNKLAGEELPHGQTYSDGERTWAVEDLWRAVEGLPTERVPLADLDVETLLDSHVWVEEGERLTVREILDHALRVEEADLSYPIILTPSGDIADGVHRVIKAYRLGQSDIVAVRLHEMPPVL